MASRAELARRRRKRAPSVWVCVRPSDGHPLRAWVGTRRQTKLVFDLLLEGQPYRLRRYEPARPKRKGVVDR